MFDEQFFGLWQPCGCLARVRLRRAWRWVLKITVGYGYESQRAFYWAIAIIGLGAGLYAKGYREGLIAPRDMTAYRVFLETGKPPPFYPRFHAFLFSLDTFLPIIDLGLRGTWTASHSRNSDQTSSWYANFLPHWTWIEKILGWTLTTLFVAGFTGLVKNG